MATTSAGDRIRALVDALVASVDDDGDAAERAARVHLSRFHFDRLVGAALGESPGAFRRRILLERAASELATGDRPLVSELALDAGYGSLAAFTRAFRRAYGVAPTAFRAGGATDFRLPAPNGVHFHPPGGVLVPGDDSRRRPMDLGDRLVEQDNLLTQVLIESAAALPDEALDDRVLLNPPTRAFSEEAPSIRSMLSRLVFTKEMWSAAIAGRAFEEADDRSLGALRERHARAGREFVELVRDIGRRDAWDTAFVDATCDPPQTFTFGAAVAHVLTWDAHRRRVVAGALAAHGVEPEPPDPIGWGRPGQA